MPEMPDRYECQQCKQIVRIGDWPFCPHGRPYSTKGFEPYYDDNLMKMISNPGDRNVELKPHWEHDNIVHIQPKERSAQYYRELNDRRRERAEKERHGRS